MKAGTRKRRSATAYRRLSYKLSISAQQRAIYARTADRLEREADRIDERAAARRAPTNKEAS